jgi:hypothetical protein
VRASFYSPSSFDVFLFLFVFVNLPRLDQSLVGAVFGLMFNVKERLLRLADAFGTVRGRVFCEGAKRFSKKQSFLKSNKFRFCPSLPFHSFFTPRTWSMLRASPVLGILLKLLT